MTYPGRLGLPGDALILLAAGDFTPGDGLRMAVWAFDVLKYAAPKLHLVLVGDGPERDRVLRFAWSLGADDLRVHSLLSDNPLAAVGDADIVWGTHPVGGLPFLRAALSHGKPTLALRTPDTESVAGLILTPCGDAVALATATRKALAELAPREPADVR